MGGGSVVVLVAREGELGPPLVAEIARYAQEQRAVEVVLRWRKPVPAHDGVVAFEVKKNGHIFRKT